MFVLPSLSKFLPQGSMFVAKVSHLRCSARTSFSLATRARYRFAGGRSGMPQDRNLCFAMNSVRTVQIRRHFFRSLRQCMPKNGCGPCGAACITLAALSPGAFFLSISLGSLGISIATCLLQISMTTLECNHLEHLTAIVAAGKRNEQVTKPLPRSSSGLIRPRSRLQTVLRSPAS